ncbi:MAG: hypothetical protein Q7S83_00360 [bacterium]|nr:hypothetical protein [bacterium]
MNKKYLRQKILRLVMSWPERNEFLTVSEIAKRLKIPKEGAAKIIFELFGKKKLEIYGQLVIKPR